MKKVICGALIMAILTQNQTIPNIALESAPDNVELYKEIAITHNADIINFYNNLLPIERIFAYYIYRAALPGNRILTDQKHRFGLTITSIFEDIVNNKELLKEEFPVEFIKEAKIYLVYLWANHGQYFAKEMSNEKRTPHKLNLITLTNENIKKALETIGSLHLVAFDQLAQYIFDETKEHTLTIPGNIEKSAVNFYSSNFTEEDYQEISLIKRSQINAYFYKNNKPEIVSYSAKGKYSNELTVSKHWLEEALKLTQKNQSVFDKHLIKSLELLIKFIETGDEELFKKHSIEWLKSNSKLDYCFGFIETYEDPKAHRGSFQAEVTIKSMDINRLNFILPNIEKQLPFPEEFKRDNLDIPNASINTLLFGSGDLGPTKIVAAYCLPNYSEIRNKFGSKQIIYASTKNIGTKLNPILSRKLFNLKNQTKWLNKVDPDNEFNNELWNLQCILHETLGHGSGKLATHTFKKDMIIGGQQYRIGDLIPVTSENITEFLNGYEAALEELRAEIIALYVCLFHINDLLKQGFLQRWITKMTTSELEEWLILNMACSGLKRYIQQSDNATEISGAHALANCTIMNYLIHKNAIEKVQETITHIDTDYQVINLQVKDLAKAKESVKELMILVQKIKSTGDGDIAKELIEMFGRPLIQKDMQILKANQRAIAGDIKSTVNLFPMFIPIKNSNNEIIDVHGKWPKDIFEQYKHYKKIELSTSLI